MRRQAQQELQEMQLHAIAEFEAIQGEPMNTPMTSHKYGAATQRYVTDYPQRATMQLEIRPTATAIFLENPSL